MRETTVWTYAILDREANAVKIGRGKNPWRRFQGLSIGNPAHLEFLWAVPYDTESKLHSELDRIGEHVRGEWFRYTKEVQRRLAPMRNAWKRHMLAVVL